MDQNDPRFEAMVNDAADAVAQRQRGPDIIQDLMARHGATEEDAQAALQVVRQAQREAVREQAAAASSNSSDGGGAAGILGFIGIIVLLNVLSQTFNWGWVFY